MIAGRLPRPNPALRLLPARALSRGRRLPVIQVAVAVALLLHVLAGIALIARPPAFLAKRAPPAPPREAEVELVQNDMPASGDVPIGGAGKTPINEAADQPSSPPRAVPPPQSPSSPPQASQVAPVAPQGEVPPPSMAAPPADPAPPAQAEQDAAPAIRLSDSDEADGMAGGSADTPAKADPTAHNRLPAYPTQAGRQGEEGRVIGIIRVKPDGTAAAVAVVQSSGYPSLDSAAVKAWRTWRFKPALDHGTPTESEVPVRLDFVLQR